ncbi:MAG: hypothetical protein AAGB04_04030 [Pseudomonadota bacterium]
MLIRRSMRIAITAGLSLISFVHITSHAALAELQQPWRVALPDGKHIQVLVERPSNGLLRAALVLLPGGDGRLKLNTAGQIGRMRNNFLVRTRHDFHRAGYLTALVDAPSDRQRKPGLLAGYRASKVHAVRDIGTVLLSLKTTFGVPVFVIGTSRGVVSAANAARRSGQTFSGVALTASITVPNRKGASLRSVMLEKIGTPTLFVHHASDGCSVTPLHGARASFERMQSAGLPVRWATVTGGRANIAPCKGKSHHGFWGVEGQAIGHLKTWIEKVIAAK